MSLFGVNVGQFDVFSLSYAWMMVLLVGFEPYVFVLKGRCPIRLNDSGDGRSLFCERLAHGVVDFVFCLGDLCVSYIKIFS